MIYRFAVATVKIEVTSLTQELTQTKSEMLASNDEEARSPELTLTKGKPDHERKHVDKDTY